jgi:hypothetical protein
MAVQDITTAEWHALDPRLAEGVSRWLAEQPETRLCGGERDAAFVPGIGCLLSSTQDVT